MKYKLNFFLISLLLIAFLRTIPSVNAINTGFLTDILSTEEKEDIISNISLTLLKTEPNKNAITCFDISKNGLIAIVQDDSDKKIICVYSSEGVFQYGYSVKTMGSLGIEWDEQYVNIYFVRSSIIVSVDQNGEIQDIYDVPKTKENNRYYNEFISAAEKTVNDTEYILTNEGLSKVLASSYTKLIVRDIDGNENTIYDVSEKKNQSIIAYCIIFVTIAVVILLTTGNKQIKK